MKGIKLALCDSLNLVVMQRVETLNLDWHDVLVVMHPSYLEMYYDNMSHIDRYMFETKCWISVH